MIKLFRLVIIIIVAISLLTIDLPIFATDQIETPTFAADHILVKYKAGVLASLGQEFINEFGGSTDITIPQLGVQIVNVPSGSVLEKISALKQDPLIEFAEPDYEIKAINIPDDPGFSQQWGLTMIQAPLAWDLTTGSPEIKIAILDSGIDQDHEDLAEKIVANQNFSTSPSVDDLFGHGTHIASIAGAITDQNKGVAGVGYNSSLMNVKVLDDNGKGSDSTIAHGIIWATDNGAKVINMSLGGPEASKTLEDAVNYAWSRGVVVVAAAGNDGNSSPYYPACYANCISVAATDQNDKKVDFSNYGSWVDVAAPGMNIFGTLPNHANYLHQQGCPLNYGSLSGTSMAAPFVSGLAALIWATSPDTSNSTVRNQIESFADQIDGTGTYWQCGRINAYKAVSQNLPVVVTGSATDLTDTSMILRGSLTNLGGATSVQVSFDYGTSYDYGNTTIPITLTDLDDFNISVTGLSPSTKYYFRAKAAGIRTAYGIQNSIDTPPYTITAEAGAGGSISPSGTLMVGYGSSQTFTFTADSNYCVGNITVDGVSEGTVSSYTFSNVMANHTITASFIFVPLPSIITDSATNVTATSAVLNGTLISMGSDSTVNVRFAWGTSPGDYQNQTEPQTVSISTSDPSIRTQLLAVSKSEFQDINSWPENAKLAVSSLIHIKYLNMALATYGKTVVAYLMPSSEMPLNLEQGIIDAAVVEVHPSPIWENYINSGQIELISWSSQAITAAVQAYPMDIQPSSLPANTYSGQTYDMPGFGLIGGPYSIELSSLLPFTTYYVKAKAEGNDTAYGEEISFTTQCTLTVNTTGKGTIVKNPDQPGYDAQTVVNLNAIPDPGWDFVGWSGDLNSNVNPDSITIDGNKNITANFMPQENEITLNLKAGWNLISFPYYLDAARSTPEIIFSDIIDSNPNLTLWGYKGCEGVPWDLWRTGMDSTSEVILEAGKGYWLNLDVPSTLTIRGYTEILSISEPPEYPVCRGWDLVGLSIGNTSTTLGKYLAGTSYTSGWIWDGGWISVNDKTLLHPGRGLWIRFLKPGIIKP